MAKKRGTEEGGGDSWLNTYADMVTLLLTFFAVLLSMSSTDEAKFNAFIRSFSALPKEVIEEIITGNNNEGDVVEGETIYISGLNELYLSLKNYVEENNQSAAVEVTRDGEMVFVRFNSLMFFAPDEYTMLDTSMPIMDFIGTGLKQYEDKIRAINICGHTADITGHGTSNVSEWFLSAERAAVVAQYFNNEKLIDGKKIIPLGYGGERPIGDNSTAEGQEMNRRVELVIVGVDSTVDFNAADPTGTKVTQEAPTDGIPIAPSTAPTTSETAAPSTAPTTSETAAPSTAPTTSETAAPSTAPTTSETVAPSTAPTTSG